ATALLSVFGLTPVRIGGQEVFVRELSRQLAERGWKSILCFNGTPSDRVREYLALPNVAFEQVQDAEQLLLSTGWRLARIIRRHRPRILHLYYTGFLGYYPWLARICSVKRVFFTDQASRPAFHRPQRAAFWKRRVVPVINRPVERVICVSRYGHR